MKKIFSIILFLSVFVVSCSKDEVNLDYSSGIEFTFEAISGEIVSEPLSKGSVISNTIKTLKYSIVDKDNNQIIVPKWSKLDKDFKSLFVEGLTVGSYKLLVYASTNSETKLSDIVIENGDFVLKSKTNSTPLDEDWLCGSVDFEVVNKKQTKKISVDLLRCVGKVNVNISSLNNIYNLSQIDKVLVSVDTKDAIYGYYSFVNKSFGGAVGVQNYDISQNWGFYCLPTNKPISGIIIIKSTQENGKKVENRYRFEGVNVKKGEITSINIKWISGDKDSGFFRVRESHYVDSTYIEMFADNEPRNVFYSRSFTTNNPLKLGITPDKKLKVNFFAPVDLKDVMVYIRFNNYSSEYFKLAKFDIIKGFSELKMPIPVVSNDCTFESKDGRRVVIPKQPNLNEGYCELKFEVKDEYMDKINAIKYPIYVTFSPYGADNGHAYWRHMTPILCKHACVLATNLSFMYSSQEFENKVNGWPKSSTTTNNANQLKDNNKNVLDAKTVIARARGVKHLNMGTVGGVAGLGGGSVFGIAPYCYTEQYHSIGNKIHWGREVIYHEFGHCMGFSHNSSMTYGDAWTRLGQEVSYELAVDGKLPINDYVNSKWVR
jgi:hypothetical protein